MILAESVDKEPEIMLGHFSIKGACLLTYPVYTIWAFATGANNTLNYNFCRVEKETLIAS